MHTGLHNHAMVSLSPRQLCVLVLLIPVLGVFTGALGLYQPLHWQDCGAMGLVVLVVLVIASVLWSQRNPAPSDYSK